VRLDPDQRSAVLWGSLAAAFLVAQQVTGKATRDALFLSHHPATALPAVMMASALVAMASAVGVGRLLASRPPRQVIPALVGLHATLLLGQFLVTLAAPGVAAILFYLQVAATGGTLLSGYWSVVNERFDPWTAKRAVTRLGLGASLGGVVGGLVAFGVAGIAPVPTMLLLTAAFNVGALVGLVRFGADTRRAPARAPATVVPPFATLRSARYLQVIALLVALGAVAEVLLDYVLKSRASAALSPGREMMSFFAAFHAGMGLLALACHVLLSRPALQGLGLAGTVALRPMTVAAASALGLVDPRLWVAVLGRGSHDVLSNSLFRSGYELLYTPVPEGDKRGTKQIVDVVFDKLGALVGGAATLAAVRFLDRPEGALLLGAGGLSLVALSLTRRLHRGYVGTLEAGLRAGKVHLDPEDVVDSTTRFTMSHVASPAGARRGSAATPARSRSQASPEPADPVLERIADLRSGDSDRILRTLGDPGALEVVLVPHLLPLVGRRDVYLDVLRALRGLAARATGQILDCILDASTEAVVRRRLPRVLRAAPSQRAVDGLLRGLDDAELPVRASCAAALAAILARSPDLKVPAADVFAAVRRELADSAPRGTVTAGHGAQEDAHLAQVFVLLSLVLEREPLRIAARAIRGTDASLRGTALEYLENVLPTEVRKPLLRRLEAPRREQGRPLDEVMTDLMRAGGSSVTARDRLRRRGLRSRD
jgi:ATP:ADP antiporter, AAA family